MATLNEIRAIKRKHAARLLQHEGVCGVDIETDAGGESVLALHVDTDNTKVLSDLPTELDGVPLKLVHSGPFRKQ